MKVAVLEEKLCSSSGAMEKASHQAQFAGRVIAGTIEGCHPEEA